VGQPDGLIGSVIDGRYEVRAQLGHGGMGRLYRAWQASVSREVAIKVIDRSLVTDPMAVTRFQREAELASKLSHPNTVSVFDSGRTPDGQLYIAMELIAGKTLTAALREQGAFGVSRIVRIGIQLCNALEAAHGMGIVHRDLKLDNVMVLERDLVKILDFGLAKRLDDMRGTAVGIVVGTPRYIAPEVSTSGIATPASDMYAIGMMLTELAVGGPLWGGDSLGQLLAKKLDPEPAIQQVPAGLRAVTSALLDVRPERRPTATQAHELLMRLARGELIDERVATSVTARPSAPTVPDRPVVRRRGRRRLVMAGAIGGAVIGGVIAFVATREHDRKHPQAVAPVIDGGRRELPVTPVGSDPWAEPPDASASRNR
jgi:serine/threonine-protein kinase